MTSALIHVPTLLERLAARDVEQGRLSVLDVRYRLGGPPGLEEYAAGHIPGAAYVDLDRDLAQPPARPPDAGGRHPLPRRDTFVSAMRRAGVSSRRPVVIYDDWQGHAAARAWWLLRHYGHRDVRVLDGSWSGWLSAGGPVERGLSRDPVRGEFDGEPGSMPVVLADRLSSMSVLVDARAEERFRGDVEPVDPVAGHIPGAVNIPTSANLRPDGTFRDREELSALYAEVGAVAETDVAVYCGSGVTACHNILALREAGVSAALYPGSWSGWIAEHP